MKTFKYIILLTILFTTSCRSQVENEIEKAHDIVEQAIQEINTEEWEAEQSRFNSEIEIENRFNILINNTKEELLINAKDSTIVICNRLFSILQTSQLLLEKKHGLNKSGELRNSMETVFVNEIFIEQKSGQKIKDQILHTISKLYEISNDLQLGISKDDLPLSLNLFMEKNKESWENYTFQDMPAIGVIPVIKKYQRDIVLTKLMMLKEIESKSK